MLYRVQMSLSAGRNNKVGDFFFKYSIPAESNKYKLVDVFQGG